MKELNTWILLLQIMRGLKIGVAELHQSAVMVGDHAALGGAYTRLFRPRQHTGLTKTT